MEIVFYNKRGTEKLCMKAKAENIHGLSETEILRIEEILSLNEGFKWLPKEDGHARKNGLALINP